MDVLAVLTCPRMGRGPSYLHRTIQSLDAQGAGEADLKVIISDGPFEEGEVELVSSGVEGAKAWPVVVKRDGPSGALKAVWFLFKFAYDAGCSRVILCEDDILCCRNAIHRVLRTKVPDDVTFVAFFDMKEFSGKKPAPGLHRIPPVGKEGPIAFWGHQTTLIPRRTLDLFLAHDPAQILAKDPSVNSDIAMGTITAMSPTPRYAVHIPNLVEHVGDVSRFLGALPRRATVFAGYDFDALSLPEFT